MNDLLSLHPRWVNFYKKSLSQLFGRWVHSCFSIRSCNGKMQMNFWANPYARKILKEMEIPDHLTCLLRNPYAGQEATVSTGHGTTDWFQIGKGVHQGCVLSPCFNLYEMPGCMKHKLKSRFLGEISITSDMLMTPPLWQKAKKN